MVPLSVGFCYLLQVTFLCSVTYTEIYRKVISFFFLLSVLHCEHQVSIQKIVYLQQIIGFVLSSFTQQIMSSTYLLNRFPFTWSALFNYNGPPGSCLDLETSWLQDGWRNFGNLTLTPNLEQRKKFLRGSERSSRETGDRNRNYNSYNKSSVDNRRTNCDSRARSSASRGENRSRD